ncbi:EscE/YscE/SsaE family type III secretion system needle protein co-chaperone [Comamonas endophytica]|uniref:EscE/YscE/SsaE family type III secretion system needle protein co-chaperone n=1 Tax=Comamonas endophytica TaxID=2949090 RepID=UPI00361387BB
MRGPDAGALREQTQAQLQALAQRAREGISAGVLPERYRELAGLVDACQAALDVIENWPAPAPGRTLPPPVTGSGFSFPDL